MKPQVCSLTLYLFKNGGLLWELLHYTCAGQDKDLLFWQECPFYTLMPNRDHINWLNWDRGQIDLSRDSGLTQQDEANWFQWDRQSSLNWLERRGPKLFIFLNYSFKMKYAVLKSKACHYLDLLSLLCNVWMDDGCNWYTRLNKGINGLQEESV